MMVIDGLLSIGSVYVVVVFVKEEKESHVSASVDAMVTNRQL